LFAGTGDLLAVEAILIIGGIISALMSSFLAFKASKLEKSNVV